MPPREGFEPTISAGERPQTYALDRAATGTDDTLVYQTQNEEPFFWVSNVWSYNQTYAKP